MKSLRRACTKRRSIAFKDAEEGVSCKKSLNMKILKLIELKRLFICATCAYGFYSQSDEVHLCPVVNHSYSYFTNWGWEQTLVFYMTANTVMAAVVSCAVPEVPDPVFYRHGSRRREQHERDFRETRNHRRQSHWRDVSHRSPCPRGCHCITSVWWLSNRLRFLCPAAHPWEQSVSDVNGIIPSDLQCLSNLWWWGREAVWKPETGAEILYLIPAFSFNLKKWQNPLKDTRKILQHLFKYLKQTQMMETKGHDQLKIFPPNYVQIPAFGPFLVWLENVQEVILALLFAHL